jgi:hypothetical protein
MMQKAQAATSRKDDQETATIMMGGEKEIAQRSFQREKEQ